MNDKDNDIDYNKNNDQLGKASKTKSTLTFGLSKSNDKIPLSSSYNSLNDNKSIQYNPPKNHASSKGHMNKSCNANDRRAQRSPINQSNKNEEESKEEIQERISFLYDVQSSLVPFIDTFCFRSKIKQTLKTVLPIIINYSILIQPSSELALKGNHWKDIPITHTISRVPHSQNASLKDTSSQSIDTNLQGIFHFMNTLLYSNPSINVIPYSFYRTVKKLKKSIKDTSCEDFCSILLKRIQSDSTDIISSLSSLYTELIQSNQDMLHFNRIIIFLNKIHRHVNATCLRDVLSLYNPITAIDENNHMFKGSSVHFINLREDIDFNEFTLKALVNNTNRIAINDYSKSQLNGNRSMNMSTMGRHADSIESELRHLIEAAEYEDALVMLSFSISKRIKKVLLHDIVVQLVKNYDGCLDEIIRINRVMQSPRRSQVLRDDCYVAYFEELLKSCLDNELIVQYGKMYHNTLNYINDKYQDIKQLINERIRMSNKLNPPCDYWIKFKLVLKNQYKESIKTLDSLYYAPKLFNHLLTIIKADYISLTKP